MNDIVKKLQQIPANQVFLVCHKNGTRIYACKNQDNEIMRTAKHGDMSTNSVSFQNRQIKIDDISDIIEV